jgi:protein O-mannosyl-transferase
MRSNKPKEARDAARKPAQAAQPARQHAAQHPGQPWGIYTAVAALAIIVLFWAYSPAMHTGFLFDDNTFQQFTLPPASAPLSSWIGPTRQLLMASYWVNLQISQQDTFSFHVFNLLFHCVTSGLIFLIVRRFLEWSGAEPLHEPSHRTLLAAFAALLFLFHPVQTESVAYIAGRSESLCGLFAAAAIAAFLYRRTTAISWSRAAAVVLLFVAAMLTKEQAVVIPAFFLLTDFWWNPGFSVRGIRGNWRLYLPLAAGATAGIALVWKMILGIGTGGSAGFGMKDFTWYQYLFTQFRALFVYLFTFVLPVNLTVDWDFPISKSILDHGSLAGLLVLLAFAAAAWHYRRRFPLAAFGYFAFLLLLAPTSSILPIKDPVAERRMYLPIIGLLLILVDLLGRLKLDRKTLSIVCAIVLLFAIGLTHARAWVWSDAIALWEDTARKSPNKARAHFQLAFAYYEQGRFDGAIAEFQKTSELETPNYNLLVDWAEVYDAANQLDPALAKLRQAAALEPTAHVYSQIGRNYAKRSRWNEAMEAFNTAEKLDPSFPSTYAYKGLLYLANNNPAAAVPEFQHALKLDPNLQPAQQGLVQAQQRLRGAR